jgi:hypothetical protein
MKLWLEGTGGTDERIRIEAGVPGRCVLRGGLFFDVTDAPSPTITTSHGRRLWLEDE